MSPARQCPHCFTTVLVGSDGRCPACGEDAGSAGEAPHEIVAMTMRYDEELPLVCFHCGGEPQVWSSVVLDRVDSTGRAIATAAVGVATLVTVGFGAFETPETRYLVKNLPACLECQAVPPRVVWRAEERRELRVVVHKKFRKALRALRRSKRGKGSSP